MRDEIRFHNSVPACLPPLSPPLLWGDLSSDPKRSHQEVGDYPLISLSTLIIRNESLVTKKVFASFPLEVNPNFCLFILKDEYTNFFNFSNVKQFPFICPKPTLIKSFMHNVMIVLCSRTKPGTVLPQGQRGHGWTSYEPV